MRDIEAFSPFNSAFIHSARERQFITARVPRELSADHWADNYWRSATNFPVTVAPLGRAQAFDVDTCNYSGWSALNPECSLISAANALLEVAVHLATFAASDNFFQDIRLAFGDSVWIDQVQDLQQQWVSQDFRDRPLIQLRSAAELNGALSGFSQETNTIYISQAILDQYATDPQAITNVLLEEFGHFIDAQINGSDAPGDEGAIFAALVQGVYLSDDHLHALKTEDDRGIIHLNGQILLIEQATTTTGNGLQAEYFDNANLTNLRLTRVDSTVNFNWGSGSPDPAIAPNTFSVRWTGQVQPTTSGTYTFFTQADDGVRLWVNGQRLINRWTSSGMTENRGTITLTAGQQYDIRLEYYENTGSAVARLLWSGPGISKQTIPQSQLFSVPPVDSTLPTASASTSNIVTTGGTTYDFTVTYADNIAINAATINGNDIRVTGPNGFSQLASLVSINTTGNGTPRTATYRINAPGGTWDFGDNGTYTLALQTNQVSDTSNNFVAAGNLGTFSVNLPDTIAPTAIATAANVNTTGGSTYQFTVTYTDNAAVNVATLNGSDILVTGPGNFSQLAALVSVNNNTNGTPRTATYQITAPSGTWDSTDNGTYTLTLQSNQVSDTSNNFIATSVLGTFLANMTPPITGQNFLFPADAGVLNVRDFGAKGDGVTDDTAAIQAALNAFPNGMRIIYLPNGTYLVSDTLTWPAGTPGTGYDYKNTIMQGQSQDGVIIRLRDGAAGFSEAQERRAVIFTGPAPAQRFGNSIRNLTVDTGIGNPGAVGIQFNASNQGSLRQVTIRSSDGQGVTGLDMDFADEIGPLLVKDVTVDGFQYGIQSGYTVNSQTFENITLRNQSVYGFWNFSQVVNIRNLTSTNSVPAIYNALPDPSFNPNAFGHMTLLNATLNGTGSASSQPAIRNGGTLLARGITTSGYQSAITSGNTTITGPTVTEFVSRPIVNSLFPSTGQTFLPVQETPDVPWDNLTDWANVVSFGAIPNDGIDDSVAFQAAIDSGKTTIYLPVGNYDLTSTVIVHNNVRRIIGTEAFVNVPNTGNPGFRIVDGNQPTVVFERIRSWDNGTPTIENALSRPRTLVVRDTSDVSLRLVGTGDLFLENVVTSALTINGQNVWARQLNIENLGTKIINNGGNLWILGLKTERGGTIIDTRNGGRTQVLGGLAYTTTAGLDGTQNAPLFINNESFVSLSFAEVNYGAPAYTTYIRETRGGVTRNISGSGLSNYWGFGKDIPLYLGY